MKKILTTLCAGLLLMATACKKEEVTVETLTPTGGDRSGGIEHPTVIPEGEGVFNPAQKIVSIMVDGEESEAWEWTDSMLTLIMTNDGSGTFVEDNSFEYNNYHVVKMHSSVQGMPYTVNYTYGGNRLASVTASSMSAEIFSIDFAHEPVTGRVSHLDIQINSTMLGLLSQFFGGGFPSFIGKASQKWSIEGVTVEADLIWQGENVSKMMFTAQLNGNVTLGEIRQMIDLDSVLGPYSMMLYLIPDTTSIPLSIGMRDTTEYTYDNGHNPFHGFLGALDPTVFSLNNVIEATSSGSAVLSATLELGDMELPISFPYSLGSITQVYTYTYGTDGYPLTVTDDKGSVKQFGYLQ